MLEHQNPLDLCTYISLGILGNTVCKNGRNFDSSVPVNAHALFQNSLSYKDYKITIHSAANLKAWHFLRKKFVHKQYRGLTVLSASC